MRPLRPSLLALAALALPPSAQVTLVVEDLTGLLLNGSTYQVDASQNGRWVVFKSNASGLSNHDIDTIWDVFRLDVQTGEVVLVSAGPTGEAATAPSWAPVVADDGTVAFESKYPMSADDTDGVADLFRARPGVGPTELVGVHENGGNPQSQSSKFAAITPDGRFVAWHTSSALTAGDWNGVNDIYLRDHTLGETTLVSRAWTGSASNDSSREAELSDDGRFVVFSSDASDLIGNGDSNGQRDVFLRDLAFPKTYCVTLDETGVTPDGRSTEPDISADGRYVVFSSDAPLAGVTSTDDQIFRWDRETGETILVSQDDSGRMGDDDSDSPCISADGRYVAFESYSRNWWNGTTPRGWSPGTQIFVRDIEEGRLHLISRVAPGVASNDGCSRPRFSDGIGRVLFYSEATDLAPHDPIVWWDSYWSPWTPATPWTYLGGEQPGTTSPLLHLRGDFSAGATAQIEVTEVLDGAPAWIVAGTSRVDLPILGGVLVPEAVVVLSIPQLTGGVYGMDSTMPASFQAGVEMFFQSVVLDAGGPAGFAFSNAVRGVSH